MNALIKVGVPLLVVGLLIFGVALAVVQEWWATDLDPGFAQHPLMLVTLYAGLLMAGIGVLVIVVGEVKRHDEGSAIRKSPQRGRPVKPPEGQPASTDPHPQNRESGPSEADATVSAKRPRKTLPPDQQVANPTSGAPGKVHERMVRKRREHDGPGEDDEAAPRS